ncbi:FAD-dependent oxidoreductase [Sphaerisporangium rufum]|uniref:FAD-dependent oxidoreductase n=1 Tax=Sphaerisporangium rufum TaxID=1381558 RepID=A0A919V836_9ACTN|nr:NAD(P)/FAD-dependent oxidoreductase [Sphaerisporangium rufum]GII80985.1 FAD-dependent oxidoreductase [Sphaerisporangium rufum]
MYDVIVVGARCAGAPTAMLLARAGYRVLLLERARFPRDTLSTHYLHQPGVARLARWGLLDTIAATGCPPLRETVYEVGGVRLTGSSAAVDGHAEAYAPRRHVLDRILAEAAAASGAELRENCTVTGLLRDGDRVCGVRYRAAGGAEFEARAPLTVGADGMRSTVARLAGARTVIEDPRLTCVYYTYWTGVPSVFELYEAPGRWVGASPTNDGATCVAAYFPQEEFETVRADVEGAYLANIRDTAPDMYRRLQGGTRVERMYGTGDQQNFFREASGPGWALVGDAGHHKDSITARGISDALTQAELLAGRVSGTDLADAAALDKALRAFGEDRDRELAEIYEATLIVARLQVQPERLTMLRAIAEDPGDIERYFSTVAGACSIRDLYTPDLLARL